MRSKLLLFLVILGLFVFAIATPLKIAFVLDGPIHDGGWNQAHYNGGMAVKNTFGNQVKITYVTNIPEGPSSLSVFRSLATQGYKLIYATSFGYMNQVAQAAKEFPKTIFEMCSGYELAPNLGEYFGRMYEVRYLTGIIAGAMSKNGKIGYVAAYPTPEVVRGIDAFTLGVRSVNPHATVRVIWTYTWYNPPTEKEAALSLINSGCDVLAEHQDSTATVQAAQQKGVYAIGYDSIQEKFGPKAYLTAAIWNWGKFYVQDVRAVLNGTWKSKFYWKGMKAGIVKLAPMYHVPIQVRKIVNVIENEIKAGTFHVFEGPIYNQNGKLMIPTGKRATNQQLLSIQWFVKGVIGKVPSK